MLWPILYTDTTDAWRLNSRHDRVLIDAGGMLAELILAAASGLLWAFFTAGFAKSIAFFLCTSSWLITLGVNLNPLLRFDGYYLLSDLFDVVNLQHKAFTLGKWLLRKKLLGFPDDAPYLFTERKVKFLIIYAYATWIYRFFLFLAIAIIVYNFFLSFRYFPFYFRNLFAYIFTHLS